MGPRAVKPHGVWELSTYSIVRLEMGKDKQIPGASSPTSEGVKVPLRWFQARIWKPWSEAAFPCPHSFSLMSPEQGGWQDELCMGLAVPPLTCSSLTIT